jgi:hypothetical protein
MALLQRVNAVWQFITNVQAILWLRDRERVVVDVKEKEHDESHKVGIKQHQDTTVVETPTVRAYSVRYLPYREL